MFSHSQRRTQSGNRFIRSHVEDVAESNPELDRLPRMAVISSVDLESAKSREEGLVKASGVDGSDGDIELDSFGTRTPK